MIIKKRPYLEEDESSFKGKPSVVSASQLNEFDLCPHELEIKRKKRIEQKWDEKYKLFGVAGHSALEDPLKHYSTAKETERNRFDPYVKAFENWLSLNDDELGKTELQFGRLKDDPPEIEPFVFRGHELIGFIDGVTKKRKVPYDHKLTSDPRRIKQSWQDIMYSIACDELGWDVDTSIFYYLIYKRDKTFNFLEFLEHPVRIFDLEGWKDRLEFLLDEYDRAWKSGIFLPRFSQCSSCSSQKLCKFKEGRY